MSRTKTPEQHEAEYSWLSPSEVKEMIGADSVGAVLDLIADGVDPEELHREVYGAAPIRRLVNRGPWPSSGGGATVNATAWNAAEGYGVTAAPSMRMVISMADFDDSRWINLTGVSGHPFSDHYTDQTDLWAEGGDARWHVEGGSDRLVPTAHLSLGDPPGHLKEFCP